MEQLEQAMNGQTTQFKVDFYEKMYCSLTKENTSLNMILTYLLTDCLYKQSLILSDEEQYKKSMIKIQKSVQYLEEMYEIRQKHHPEYKSDAEIEDFRSSVIK